MTTVSRCSAFLSAAALAAAIAAGPLRAQDDGGDAAYQALLDAWKAKSYAEALALAEGFLAKHPGHRHAAAALYLAGNSALREREHDRAAAFHRRLLAEHPAYKMARAARDELASALAESRDLGACIAQCDANLRQDAAAPQAPRWRFLRAHCLFRLWRFDEARKALEEFLAAHPDAPQAAAAREDLALIEPKLEADASGLVRGYAGKYAADARFRAAAAAVPRLRGEAFAAIAERLGADLREGAEVLYRFEDAGFEDRKGLRGNAMTAAVRGRPVTLVTFFAEYVVLCPEDFRQRFVHETKHAAFRSRMGQAYVSLPKWVREGLAVWAAGQLPDRMRAILSDQVFSGGDPLKVLDGIGAKGHDTSDYLQDALAFEWLEGLRAGAVKEFAKRILAGEDPAAALSGVAGLPPADAFRAADAHARARVLAALGPGYEAFRVLRDAGAGAQAKGASAVRAWLDGGAAAALEKWLETHPGHPLEPNARYLLGKCLVLAGSCAEGRARLGRIVAEDFLRTSICDDAAYWIARSYETEANSEAAAAAFGVYLRDYSWSKKARELKDRYPIAGPEGAGEAKPGK
ncbi:MAG: tetratricopeptide repeat protein [Planctomycetes bacterium]|nr:tetratricopeptide repeat protein [Planctomycetota bacterium]